MDIIRQSLKKLLLPGTLPVEATDSMNLSSSGKGDFPIKYVAELL